MATLLSCIVPTDWEESSDSMRAVIVNYAARFPRYRRLMEEAGFSQEIEEVRRAWREGNQPEAMRLVPSGLIEKMAVVGTPEECRHRIQDYRDAGITLPIISPRVSGPGAKGQALEIIRACAGR